MEWPSASGAALPVPSRRPPSPERQDLFLSRSCPTNVMDDPYRPLEASTSSPLDFNGGTNTLGTSPPNAEGQLRPTRQRPRNRIFSSSVSPRRRGKSASRTRPSTIFASFNQPSPKPEWSVFGQRMENEGQMRTRNTLRESMSEDVVPSPFRQTTDLAARSESPTTGAPPLRRVAVDGGHGSDDASTIWYDSESDSEDSSRPSTPISASPPRKRRWYQKWKLPPLSPLQRNILKCSVAYFLGSLFTFNLTLSSLVASLTSTEDEPAPSKLGHLVATV